LAAFAPLLATIFASIAVPLSAQLLPALLGLAFVPWISRSAILAGLILGGLIVLFTEPPGLILFEGLFLDLPWGRWPLTIHSAAWGLAFNLGAVLLVSIFTRRGAQRDHRDRLHAEFTARWKTDFGGPAARGAKWSLSLIWAFLAIGPGAILGNIFFSQPIFSSSEAVLGIPSLWVWQMLFWLIGVLLVWWIAYRCRLGITTAEGLRRIDLGAQASGFGRRRAPSWIASSLARLTEP
jgi:solute:Na+ symporter, SSS family